MSGALDPSRFLLFSDAQYEGRLAWNRKTTSGFQKVPDPFDEEADVAWSRVWSLTSGTSAFLPASMLYMGVRGPGSRMCYADSNGLAAGSYHLLAWSGAPLSDRLRWLEESPEPQPVA